MSIFKQTSVLSVSILILVLLTGGGSARANTINLSCPEMPLVPWWTNNSPDQVSSYVSRKYDGDWSAYIGKWRKQGDKLLDLHLSQKKAIIKSRNIVLEGEQLAIYVKMVEKRVKVIECYAHQSILKADKGGSDKSS